VPRRLREVMDPQVAVMHLRLPRAVEAP
jgi:hypothetical protein